MNLLEKIKLLPDALLGQLFSDPERNGEYKFLKQFLSSKEKLIIFDVGANVGDYSKKILGLNQKVVLYCFEPVQSTYNSLSKKLENKSNVLTFNFAFGDNAGEKNIFIYGENAGSNSLYYNERHSLVSKDLHKEKIKVETLDHFIRVNKISKIDFLKIDVEGHELKVLEGAIVSLKNQVIHAIQFEYNDYWLRSAAKLEEIFNLLIGNDFKLYRLTPWGKITVKHFNKKLENYKQSNYVAILNE